MHELPQIGSRLAVQTGRTTGESGDRLKAAGAELVLTVSDVSTESVDSITAKVNEEHDEQRFVWDDIKAGVTERLIP